MARKSVSAAEIKGKGNSVHHWFLKRFFNDPYWGKNSNVFAARSILESLLHIALDSREKVASTSSGYLKEKAVPLLSQRDPANMFT